MKQLIVPIERVKPDPNQPRKSRNPEDQRRLNESVAVHGVLQPIGVRPDGMLVWGEGRWLAAIAAALKEIPAILLDKPMTEAEYLVLQIVENMARSALVPVDQWRSCVRLMQSDPSLQLKDVARLLSIDPSMVTRLLSPSKCILPVQEALAAGRLGISDCYALSKVDEAQQAEMLVMKLNGASRDAIEQHARKRKAATAPTVRLSRVKIALPEIEIVVTGDGISLDEVIESLGEAAKEAKKAREQGLDAKTFQAVMRDRAVARTPE